MILRKNKRKKEVLKWINDYRFYKQDREPLAEIPKGIRGCSLSCPIAKAVNHATDGHNLFIQEFLGPLKSYPLPEHVSRFISDFDNEKYPELVIDDGQD